MSSKKIVIASVLKPVDDTRMLEKFGASLVQTPNYDVNIVGFYSKTKSSHPRIHFYPIFRLRRISLARLFAGFRFLSLLFKLSPHICIVTTAELLPAAITYKLLKGGRLLYDVQENYYRNIIYSPHYAWGIRQIAGALVRITEHLTRWGIDHYILAEKCYSHELGFVPRNHTIVENKYQPIKPDNNPNPKARFNLIYSGTIALHYGIFQAIELFTNLYQLENRYRLTIVGHCAHSKTRARLRRVLAATPGITVIGLDHLVPHPQVIDQIQAADFGIIAYHPNPATAHCLPTRIYEYLGNKLPMVLPNNPQWVGLCQQFQGGISINYDDYDPKDVHSQIQEGRYYPNGNDGDIYWYSEEKKLLNLLLELD